MTNYILPVGALDKFTNLRADYQAKKKVNLDEKPSMFGTPTFFGGVNVHARKAQIDFLEKIHTLLKPNILPLDQLNNEEKTQANLLACSTMIAACLYVQSQIPMPQTDSMLYNLIEGYLGKSQSNSMDSEDRVLCYYAGHKTINFSPYELTKANAYLKKQGKEAIAEAQWTGFSQFLQDKYDKNKASQKNPYSNYVVTSITQPLFGLVCGYAGATVGVLAGEVLAQTTSTIPANVQLTALIGGSVLILGPAGPSSAAYFAPIIASKIITTFCSISMGHLLGKSMNLVGQGVGIAVGLPFDLAFQALSKLCSGLSTYYYNERVNMVSGLRIATGAVVIQGAELSLMSQADINNLNAKNVLNIDTNGQVRINGQVLINPETKQPLPPIVIEELKSKISTPHDEESEKLLASSI